MFSSSWQRRRKGDFLAMNKTQEEIEVKFWLADAAGFILRLEKLGARLVTPRVLEVNLRFDTPDGALSRERRVLRLRRDDEVHLTYKGPAKMGEGVSTRQEIEFEANSYENARDFLLALGYQVNVIYEKYRTSYELNNVVVTLDEVPFGNISEIEGPDAVSIQAAAAKLGLDWEARSMDSYLQLFGYLQQAGLAARNLRFEEFQGLSFKAEDVGMRPADG
jgi:adenylate cyclase class 2